MLFKSRISLKIITSLHRNYASSGPRALRSKKGKSHSGAPPRGLVDMREVSISGGRGGDGCVSFLRLWVNDHAGPDGGDGGNGADVVLESCGDVKDLSHFDSVIRGPDGIKGSNKDCHGANAKPLLIKLPLGTLVRKFLADGKLEIAADLEEKGDRFIAARGGAGGKGNHFFASPTNQSPEVAELGAQGESYKYLVEIRSMAHIGLIGFPNAGKSTLLQAISRARPKVAPYPFTTQQPFLGVVPFSDYQQVIVADLPGLIENSHKNRGLGYAFLRHATRCLALIFVVDLSQEWPQPLDELIALRHEIREYSSVMAKLRPWAIAGNKIDLPQAQANLPLLKHELRELLRDDELEPKGVMGISAKTGLGLPDMLKVVRQLYDENVKDNEEDL